MNQTISINSNNPNSKPVGNNFLYDDKFTTKSDTHIYGFKPNIPFLYSMTVMVKPSDFTITYGGQEDISISGEYIKDFQFDTSIGLKTVQVPQLRYFETVPVPSININNEITITFYINSKSLKSLTEQFSDKLKYNHYYIKNFSVTYSYIYTDKSNNEHSSDLTYFFNRIEILEVQYPNITFTRSNNEFMMVSITGVWLELIIKYNNETLISLTQ